MLTVEEAQAFKISCTVLDSPAWGFKLVTGIMPDLTIDTNVTLLSLRRFNVEASTRCCNSTTVVKQIEDGFYLVCAVCGEWDEFEASWNLFNPMTLEDYLATLVPSHWNMLERDLFLPHIHRAVNLLMEDALSRQPVLERDENGDVTGLQRDAVLEWLTPSAAAVNARGF